MTVFDIIRFFLASVAAWEGAKRLLRPALIEAAAIAQIYRIRRQARKQLEHDMATIAKIKAPIVSVGDIMEIPGGVRLLGNWQFDMSTGAMPHRVDAKGNAFYCGYSQKELREIHARRDEYVNRHDA